MWYCQLFKFCQFAGYNDICGVSWCLFCIPLISVMSEHLFMFWAIPLITFSFLAYFSIGCSYVYIFFCFFRLILSVHNGLSLTLLGFVFSLPSRFHPNATLSKGTPWPSCVEWFPSSAVFLSLFLVNLHHQKATKFDFWNKTFCLIADFIKMKACSMYCFVFSTCFCNLSLLYNFLNECIYSIVCLFFYCWVYTNFVYLLFCFVIQFI